MCTMEYYSATRKNGFRLHRAEATPQRTQRIRKGELDQGGGRSFVRASGEDGDLGPRGAGGGLWEEMGKKEFLMYSGPPLIAVHA